MVGISKSGGKKGYSLKSRVRDQKLKQQKELNKRAREPHFIRAVLTDSQGNTTGTGSVYFDESERMVWFRHLAASQPAKVKCDEVEPRLGLPVVIGIPEGGTQPEVLRVDPQVKRLDPTAGPQKLIHARQLEPGGAFMMWLYPKAFVPLAVHPSATGLTVSIAAGYYTYDGKRQNYVGSASVNLASSQPGAGLKRLVGLYLLNNTLSIVNGATVALAGTAPEPDWPVGAYQVAAISLNDTQTKFTFSDVDTRGIVWSLQKRPAGARLYTHQNFW